LRRFFRLAAAEQALETIGNRLRRRRLGQAAAKPGQNRGRDRSSEQSEITHVTSLPSTSCQSHRSQSIGSDESEPML
jgi:hypothetical protein